MDAEIVINGCDEEICEAMDPMGALLPVLGHE